MAIAKGQALINEITAQYLQDRPKFRAGDNVNLVTNEKEYKIIKERMNG